MRTRPCTLPKIFSFRAECSADVAALAGYLAAAFPAATHIEVVGPNGGMPDVEIELRAAAHVSLEALRNTVRAVPDSHVMWQTLRELPLAQNSLERDWNAGAPHQPVADQQRVTC